ncbi:CPBP family intramembrane glutamic endopeptidase [Prolixibacter denitrificans]|uniref:CAAX prenyl protease-like protein n=1 Tax=Prolixibacter denitrificans TaxID=1541063 RepID=A0A2P8CHD7_9BACT|nr:type II CAAX endopeptidase family protein [Prolixibacter denitrificans]PSK84346.1 CAAX prenyl protease-like protein [Prolixibacter denitrificans]
MSRQEKQEIIVFSVSAIILSSLICFVAYKTDNSNLSILSVFTPSVLALVFTAINKGKKGVDELFVKQTIRKTKFKWLLVSLLGIPIVASLAVLTSLNFELSKFSLRTSQLMPQVVVIILIALGEEYGWRGFLLPRLLKRLSLFSSAIILGFIWGFWHFPAYLIGTGVPLQMNFLVFLLWVVLGSLFIGWIYYYTRSVLTSILAHISANLAFNYLMFLPEFTGSMKPFWFFILYLSIMMLVVLYVTRKDLVKSSAGTLDATFAK